MEIVSVEGIEVLDSRGNPTVEVRVILEDGAVGTAGTAGKYIKINPNSGVRTVA